MWRRATLAIGLGLAACGPAAVRTPSSLAPEVAIELTARAGSVGLGADAACLVVRDPDGRVRTSDATCGDVRLRPASTFKLPNALIAADVGLLRGPDAVLRYAAARYPAEPDWPEGWAQDQPLSVALEISAVPLFRLLATEIGAARMQAHLDALGYGNRSIAGGLDTFWLTGALAISAYEQVEFVRRLVAGTLPVSARAQEIVRIAAPREEAADATLHWKTGTAHLDDSRWVGWLVGWIDRPDGAHAFACWIQEVTDDMQQVRAHRAAVCRGALADLGLFPAPTP